MAPNAHPVVVTTSKGGFRTEITAGKHKLVADEPIEVPGGTDQGPTPYDLLASALGACTAMTLHMYAERKKWPLERVTVSMRHDKVHADDCRDCETKVGKIDVVERELKLEGPLTEEMRARLAEIAEMCPVQRTLGSEFKVRTRLI
ncbi:MAG: OsmC family protein [Myxococcaceae bacterium]